MAIFNEEMNVIMNRFRLYQEMHQRRLQQLDDEEEEGRFHMPRHLVKKIIEELCRLKPQFNYQFDALNIKDHSLEQKVTSDLRILGYDIPADAKDEYLRMGCPVYWAGQYKSHYPKPTVILEVVASYDCWIWHSCFGLPGSQNDINVLHKSPLFEDLKYGICPQVRFTINGHQYTHGYYLADGIYPKWSTLVQCYRQPPVGALGRSHRHFNTAQMAARKDVERAFGILKRKFTIICGPYRGLSPREMRKTMLILHNMIIQETRRDSEWTNYEDEDLRPEIHPQRGVPARNYAQMTNYIQNQNLYDSLRDDLRVNLWAEHGRQ
ncbi:uncharacterized protein LOC113332932 [Papaver somniferum]|uniref:uncharacterized protein LOC113332932 n=1 Tax=Papaver somniferum TaxID=3469 RepID=UPI000E7048FA|nr:uncharacterized protein LOC113332932 [Papaver somniferum]